MAVGDKFRKGQSLFSTTSNSFGTGTGETITLSSVSGLPTDTAMVLTFDRDVAGKLERILGTISGSNFVIETRGVDGTSDQSHTSPTVEYIDNAKDRDDLIDGILVAHAQTGIHKSGATYPAPVFSTSADLNGVELIVDADADSSLTADTDDRIDVKLSGADRYRFGVSDFDIVTATGNVQVAGADPKRGIYVPVQAMYPSSTAGCAALTQVETATNKVNVKVLDFDGAGTSKENAEFGLPSPLYWDASTVTAQFVWYATAGSGTVNWECSAGAFSDDDALDAAYGTLQEVTDTLLATGDVHISAATSAITVAGTPVAGDWVMFRVARDPANDTNTSDARLLGVIIRFGVKQYNDA